MTQATPLRFEDLGIPLIDTTFSVIDLETTGLHPDSDAITEIGVVKVRAGDVIGELSTFVHPRRPIPSAITRLTGIRDQDVKDAPAIGEALSSLEAFLQHTVLVAHNARFDRAFLTAAAQRHGYDLPSTWLDTMRLARRLMHGEVPNLRLETLARHFASPTRPTHRALLDARATVAVFHGLLERAGSLGATTVDDLLALTRIASDRRFRRRSLVADAPNRPGVYRFVDRGGIVLYVGKATDLRGRLQTYFRSDPRRQIEQLIRLTTRVEWEETPTALEAAVREMRQILTLQPAFNRRGTSVPTPWFVALTDEPFPRLTATHRPSVRHTRIYGPVSTRSLADQFIEAVTHLTGLRPCTLRLRARQDHPACNLAQIGRCGAVCDGSRSRADYQRDVDHAIASFDDAASLLRAARGRMLQAAAGQRYETAEAWRRRMCAIATVLEHNRRHRALHAAGRMVIHRQRQDGIDIVAIDHARFLTSFHLTPRDDPAFVQENVASLPAPSPVDASHAFAEERLIVRALDDHDWQLLEISGTLAVPVVGGLQIARTMSNHGLSNSGGRPIEEDGRASQRSRTRYLPASTS